MNSATSRLIFFLLFLVLNACTKEKTKQYTTKPKQYSIYAMMKDGKEYLIHTDSLTAGSINPALAGATVVPGRLFYDLIVKNGYYYWVDWKRKTFEKYIIKEGKFTKESELALKGISAIENYNWISRDSLLIIGYDEIERKVRYAKIHVDKMEAVQGEMPIPKPFGGFNSMSVGFSRFLNAKLQVGYTYHTTNVNSYTTSDTIYVETLSYPGMEFLCRSKDVRSAYPAGPNTRQSHFFTDETGDFYFIGCPGIASGNNPEKPTGIFRIKAGETEIDKGYFFNISTSQIQNHGYGLWYLGNGKAIVRTERKGVFTGMKDHWKVPHFDFYVLDLNTKSTTRLALPLDKGTARQCILVENGQVYITVNSDSEGSYIWSYDPETTSLKRGIKFDGEIDYVLRLERLN